VIAAADILAKAAAITVVEVVARAGVAATIIVIVRVVPL
jgi:hypothetical protein